MHVSSNYLFQKQQVDIIHYIIYTPSLMIEQNTNHQFTELIVCH